MPYISHEKLIEDNKPEYYINLRKSQKTLNTKNPDLSYWLDFFLDVILKQSQMAVELLSEENIEKLLSKKQLLVWEYLQSVEESAPLEITKITKVKRPTVNQVLVKLLQLEKVKRIGLGRGTRYRVKKILKETILNHYQLLLFLPDYHQTQSLYLPSGRNKKDTGRKNAKIRRYIN